MSHNFTRYIPNGSGRDYFIAMDSSMTRGKHDFSYYEINPPTEARVYREEKKLFSEAKKHGDSVPFAHVGMDKEAPRTKNYIAGYRGHAPGMCDTVGISYSRAAQGETCPLKVTSRTKNLDSSAPNSDTLLSGIDPKQLTTSAMLTCSMNRSSSIPSALLPSEADIIPGYGGHRPRRVPKSVLQHVRHERSLSPMSSAAVMDHPTRNSSFFPKKESSGSSIPFPRTPDARKLSSSENEEQIAHLLAYVRSLLKSRGADCIVGLARSFRITDKDKSGKICLPEFRDMLDRIGLGLDENELQSLFSFFDRDGSYQIDYDEFLSTVRGELNDRRRAIVRKAFEKLDKDGSGVIEVHDLIGVYDVSSHPKVRSGESSQEEVLRDFLDVFDGGKKDGYIFLHEFEQYYADISAGIDDDDIFVQIVKNAWKL